MDLFAIEGPPLSFVLHVGVGCCSHLLLVLSITLQSWSNSCYSNLNYWSSITTIIGNYRRDETFRVPMRVVYCSCFSLFLYRYKYPELAGKRANNNSNKKGNETGVISTMIKVYLYYTICKGGRRYLLRIYSIVPLSSSHLLIFHVPSFILLYSILFVL